MSRKAGLAGLRFVAAEIALFLATFGALDPALAAVASPHSASLIRIDFLQDASTPILEPRAAISVMIVGDSITQGHEGDWTWRYRLWQWFQEQGVTVDFVGPWVGTRPPDPAGPPVPPTLQDAPPPDDAPSQITTGGYAVGVDSNFGSDHFSAWGQLAQQKSLIRGMVATYQPDYLLVLLGFNDIGWFISDAEGTFESMETFIGEARAAKPDVKFALSNIPQRTFIGGRDDLPVKTDVYNQILAGAIPWLSTSTSQVELVKMRENYECDIGGCPAGYDGLHPNVLGEYQIAQAFSQTLFNNFGIGTSGLVIPANLPVRPINIPTNFRAVSSPQGITVTWDAVYGAIGYDLQYKATFIDTWTTWSASSNRYDTSWVLDGWEYEFMIRTSNGDKVKTDWSGIITAVCHPQTPSAPTSILTTATATGVDISWDNSGYGITEWAVLVYDRDTVGAFVNALGIEPTRLSAHVDSLTPGIHYIIAVQGWNQYGGGFPGVGRGVTVGDGTPPAPTNLQITSIDGTTIHLDWCGSPQAAGYRFWYRNINIAGSVLYADNSSSTATNWGVAYLFPGVWNYEFCISAFNGEFESPLSTCVTCPQPGQIAGGPVGGAGCYSGGNVVSSGWGDPTPSCISGTGPGNYASLCIFSCSLGFCPSPCTCTAMGPQAQLPASTGDIGYPLSGEDDSYYALCGFACSLGYCPASACTGTAPSSGGGGSGSGGEGVIYLPPSIWSSGPKTFGCDGDCTFILPPSPLPTPEVISWPPLTTTLLSSSGGAIYTKTTTISIAPFTITEIQFWSVTVTVGDPTVATFVPEQSVMPPGFILTLPGTEATFPPTTFPLYSDFQPVSTASSSSTTPVPFFFAISYGVSIQPQPTILISTPLPTTPFTYSSTSEIGSQPTCTSHCGSHNCGLFGCGTGCGIFGCGGGCGIFGCGGGCGILGCGGGCRLPGGCGSTDCPLINPLCSNPGCVVGCPGPEPGIGEGEGEGEGEGDQSSNTKACATSTIVTMCEVACTVTDYQGGIASTTTGCGSTSCTETITGCDVTGTTVTSEETTTINCPGPVPFTSWWTSDNDLAPTLGVDVGYIAQMGTWTPPPPITYAAASSTTPAVPTSSTPTETTSNLPVPTVTSLNSEIYCFDQNNPAGTYVPFNITGANAVIDSLCGNGRTLGPGGPAITTVYTDPTGINIIANVQWAPNQSGCKAETSVPMNGDICTSGFDACAGQCDGGSTTSDYGGAYIFNSGDGCLQWELYAVLSGTGESACHCNEDSCTPDSPACCANGSCGTSNEVKIAQMKLIPASALTSKRKLRKARM